MRKITVLKKTSNGWKSMERPAIPLEQPSVVSITPNIAVNVETSKPLGLSGNGYYMGPKPIATTIEDTMQSTLNPFDTSRNTRKFNIMPVKSTLQLQGQGLYDLMQQALSGKGIKKMQRLY